MRTVYFILIGLICLSFNMTLVRQKTLPELIFCSDNILIGQINAVTDTSLTLITKETIKGKFVPSFTIYKKQKGHYNTRKLWTNKRGQSELLFLSYDKDEKKYELYTDHGEAEYAIKDSLVFIYGRSWYLKKNNERYQNTFVDIDSNSVEAAGFGKIEFCNAIKDYLKSAKLLVKKMYKEPDIQYMLSYKSPPLEDVIFTDKDINNFLSKSKSHQRLIHELMDDPNNNLLVGY